jgi:uncharacterized protein
VDPTYLANRPAPTGAEATRRWLQLLGGLLCFGVAIALMIGSRLGLGPWDAFHFGLHRLTGISVGGASIVVGLVILAGTRFLDVRPGAGTVANMLLIGVFIDLLLPHTPVAANLYWGAAYYLTAIALAGLGTGMYIGAGLGQGPRDGMMLGISLRMGWPVRRVRTAMELTVLLLGWAMGGTVGVGTLLFATLIGPSAQWGLQLFGVVGPRPSVVARRSPVGRAGRPGRSGAADDL